jgi:hypothetical protein
VLHLPSAATVSRSAPTPQNRLQAFLSVISLDLFALLRSRSTGTKNLYDIRPVPMMQCNIVAVNNASRQLPNSRFCREKPGKFLVWTRKTGRNAFLISYLEPNFGVGEPGIARFETGNQMA